MISPPIPADESQRLAALARVRLLDTPPEAAFDNIARLAAQICQVPIALVSLIDERREWFKARVGLDVAETPREQSFYAHAISDRAPLVVPDALRDVRFSDNPLVRAGPNIRFYVGVPVLAGDGAALGTLCVMDRVPRELTAAQMDALSMLAGQVSRELGLRAELDARTQDDAPLLAAGPSSVRGGPEPESWRERSASELGSDATAVPSAPGSAPASASASDVPVRTGAWLEHRYQIEGALGGGSMGLVFRARDREGDRPVAIKFLRRNVLSPREAINRFAREARAMMQLRGEHVVHVLAVGNTDDDVPYIVMEYLEGEELGARLAARGPFQLADAIGLIVQACDVLAEAHQHGIIHRDIKPANLFLARRADGGEVLKVLDFGIAKLADAALPAVAGLAPRVVLTAVQTIMGTPPYMPPEQMMGESTLDARADVWAIGVVLFQLLSGQVPFAGASVAEMCTRAMTEPCPSLRALRPDVPPKLESAIARCLAKDPAQRWPSIAELARALVQTT